MSARKPDISVTFKAAAAGPRDKPIPFAAFWKENGRLSGGLDKRVKRLRIELEDGTVIDVQRVNGKLTHWCNARDWSAAPAGRQESWGGRDDEGEPF